MATLPRSSEPSSAPAAAVPVRVWDLPTRLFHWLLVLAVVFAFISGEVGGNAMTAHMWAGCTAGALLVFRLIWGVVGGRWSRFANFVRTPATILRYLKGQTQPQEHLDIGHNPLGSLSVLAMLGLLLAQVASGLIADDDIATKGPLNAFVSSALAEKGTFWHTEVGKLLLLVLVALHVAALVYYRRVKKLNLVTPMVLGDKALPAGTPASTDTTATRLLALAVAGLCAAGAWWIMQLG